MTQSTITWGGTDAETSALLEALARNCACTIDPHGVRTGTCPAHAMLLDQRSLDHLLFGRRLAERLWVEEFQVAA